MELKIKKFEDLTVEELFKIYKLRISVFAVEQNCAYQEVDETDKKAYHLWLQEGNHILAYLRVMEKGVSFEEASIGRVLTAKRGCGLGAKIFAEGIQFAKDRLNADKIVIEAQVQAKEFYEKFGFRQISEPFSDAGIMHIKMICNT